MGRSLFDNRDITEPQTERELIELLRALCDPPKGMTIEIGRHGDIDSTNNKKGGSDA